MGFLNEYELIKEQDIPEIKSNGFYYRHKKTGAEILSIVNDDENKVFGITFRTPPSDSTGLPHILEHSVLCGSRKYPVKEPFVELVKGSLNTFLNAMTYPDKTCYPVASQNHADFYNLIDVYLDAVFYPRLTPFTFQQEGWHYELKKPEGPLSYKGVVFSEMKGSYSSPDSLIYNYSMRSLFPDNAYGLASGGDPKKIPDLTFEQFLEFHKTYYHPSNSRIFFYGDDNPEKRLLILNEYLDDFDKTDIDSRIVLQKNLEKPRRIIRAFGSGTDNGNNPRGMFTLNWLLPESSDRELYLAMHFLDYILLGMPGSPLRRALIESNLGEDLVGVGLESELRQMYFSTGLKGIDLENVDRIQNLIIHTLSRLVDNGIDHKDKEAAMNSLEFILRENNTGAYPRGLTIMLRSLTTWLHDEDPFSLIAFEKPLNKLKSSLAGNKASPEEMIERYFLSNPHRTSLILKPVPHFIKRERMAEEKRLSAALAKMSPSELQDINGNADQLRQVQETPDSADAIATIPLLRLSDLEKENKIIPISSLEEDNTDILYHELFTNKILYIDVGFNLHNLPAEYLPYARLFGKALLEMGTLKQDYVTISQCISRKTGGISTTFHTSAIKDSKAGNAWMFLRGKSMISRVDDLLDILKQIILNVRFDNRERFKQMVLEAKAEEERKLMSAGHHVANLRLRSHFCEADWAAEQISGLSYLYFLRELVRIVDEDWSEVLSDLKRIHGILINRKGIIINITVNGNEWPRIYSLITKFIKEFPEFEAKRIEWSVNRISPNEGITIPSQVNYVAKGINLYDSGYIFHGSSLVICRFLRTTWLWEQVRVKGGAYGIYCSFDRLSGTLTYLSYRDPNILNTVRAFDKSGDFLKDVNLNESELTKGIIGTIGSIDSYMLPDVKGYISMLHWLSDESHKDRQIMREEILTTRENEFQMFADVLNIVKENGLVKIVGSNKTVEVAMKDKPEWLKVVSGV